MVCLTEQFFILLPVPSRCHRSGVIGVGNDDSTGGIGCVDNLSATNVEGYMVDASAGGIKEEVAGLKAVKTHGSAAGGLGGRRSGKADAKVGKDRLNKTGAIGAVGQAGAAVYIRITYKLKCVAYNTLTNAGRAGA